LLIFIFIFLGFFSIQENLNIQSKGTKVHMRQSLLKHGTPTHNFTAYAYSAIRCGDNFYLHAAQLEL